MIYGNFQFEVRSDYEYRRGTTVKIDGVRYEIVKEIIDAISPILEKEVKMIKQGLEEND